MDEIRFPTLDGREMRGALAIPEGAGPWPGVIVIHEAFGLNDQMRGHAERLAELGYVALAPDLLDRPGFKPFCIQRTLRQLGKGEGDAFEDLEAARRWLGERDEVDGGRMGVMGFCMGGGFALLLAARGGYGAAAAFYGQVPADPQTFEGSCPVFAAYGAKDRLLRKQAPRLKAYLSESSVPHVVKMYPGVGHSFMNRNHPVLTALMKLPLGAGYNEDAAEDAWARVDAFFGEHLGPAGGGMEVAGDV